MTTGTAVKQFFSPYLSTQNLEIFLWIIGTFAVIGLVGYILYNIGENMSTTNQKDKIEV
jgi:hypothetical protein